MRKDTIEDFTLFEIQQEVFDRAYPVDSISECVNDLVGEIGEFSNLVKKRRFYKQKKLYRDKIDGLVKSGKRMPWEEMEKDELGDAFFYFVKLVVESGYNLNEIWQLQLGKLARQDEEVGEMYQK